MRSRTAFCSHGFLIPGKPEPWTVSRAEGGAELKASRFCLKCWKAHRDEFVARGYGKIEEEDPCTYGFLDVIHSVLSAHAWYRDQDRYQSMEGWLRLHLIQKKSEIEKVVREHTEGANAYVRRVVDNRLIDLQRSQDKRAEQNWTPYDDTLADAAGERGSQDVSPDDENGWAAKIVDSIDPVIEGEELTGVENRIADELVAAEECAAERQDPLPRTKKGLAKENARLVRDAIEEQSHRINALQTMIQREVESAESKERRVLKATDSLPPDPQTIFRMRHVDGNKLRDKPRPRTDILRELRLRGNALSSLSEWDLRRLEDEAIFRLRRLVQLPPSFRRRDSA